MLVLSRKTNESVMFDDTIKVTVISVNGDKVRLGIEAPSSVAVHRTEVYERIIQAGEPLIVDRDAVLKASAVAKVPQQ